jgi:predicted DNA-binding protein
MSTLSITIGEQTEHSLHELALQAGKTDQELISEAIEKYIAIREFYSIRNRIIESAGLINPPTEEEIFEMVS